MFDIELHVNAEAEYAALFGENVSKNPKYAEHYTCFSDYAKTINILITQMVEELDNDLTLRIDFNEEMEKQNGNTRVKRAFPVAAAAFAIVGMVTSVGTIVYVKLTKAELLGYLTEVAVRMDDDENFIDQAARHTRVLQENQRLIGIKTNIIIDSFEKFKKWRTCSGLKLVMRFDKERVYHHLLKLRYDLTSDRLTPALLPMRQLVELVKKAPDLIKDTIFELDLVRLYSEARISLMSVNKEKSSIRVVVIVPRIHKEAHFRQINILSPAAVISRNDELVGRHLQGLGSIFLPIAHIEKSTEFPLSTAEDVKLARRLTGCRLFGSRKVCDGESPLEPSTVACIQALLGGTDDGSCDFGEAPIHSIPLVSLDRGVDGILISSASTAQVIATDGARRETIHHGAPTSTGHRQCLFVPSHYERIEVKDGKETEYIQQSMTLATNLFRMTPELVHYELEARRWNTQKIGTLNISDIEALKDRQSHDHLWLGRQSSNINLLAILGVSCIILIGVAVKLLVDRRDRKLLERHGFHRSTVSIHRPEHRPEMGEYPAHYTLPENARTSRNHLASRSRFNVSHGEVPMPQHCERIENIPENQAENWPEGLNSNNP